VGAFRYDEIGQRLRAFRLASGLSTEEVCRRIGISRTALYRFEKGELVKIETLEKLAELLDVSIPTLLGVGIEYIPSAVAYFERMRQIEQVAEHIINLSGPISFLLASEAFEQTLEQVLTESVGEDVPDRQRALDDVPRIMAVLRERKETYRRRRPNITNLISAVEIERFLYQGFIGRRALPETVVDERRALARAEVAHFLDLIAQEPIGIQIGIVTDSLPYTGFQLYRQPERKVLVLSPFRLGEQPNVRVGVAMITSAPEALALHEKVVADLWHRALKGTAAATFLRSLLQGGGVNFRSESPLEERRRTRRSRPAS
jgi:transcriptional regulator with XRE-family HTH domain